MEQRVLGKTGLHVGVLGFGGAEIGFERSDTGSVKQIVNEALENGITFFDSAAAYLESEQLLGEALVGRRHEIVLTTKCGALDGFRKSDWTKRGLLTTIETSLKNLRTDYLDIILLHSCDPKEFKTGEALTALRIAQEKGYARFIGYSGDSASAREAIESNVFDVLETSVSIADQESIELLLPLAKEKNLGVIAKRPVANAAWRTGRMPMNAYHQEYWRRLEKLQYPFLKKDLSTAVPIALRFTLSQNIHCAIVGTAKPGRIAENVQSIREPLPKAEIDAIRARWREVAEPSWVGQV